MLLISFRFSVSGRVMETKSLVVILLVSYVFLSVCLQPASSQGIRWGREFEEEHPKIERLKANYLRRKQMRESFDDATEKGEKKIENKYFFPSTKYEVYSKLQTD